jgi:hypothetical protein
LSCSVIVSHLCLKADRQSALLQCAEHREVELFTRAGAIEDFVERVDALHGLTSRCHDQIPAFDSCTVGGAFRLDRSYEDAVALR